MLSADEVPVHQLLDDLRQIRLKKAFRVKVTQARVVFEAHGNLPLKVVSELRGIHRRHARQIQKVYEAQERARISMAKERTGLSDEELKKRRDQRISGLRRRVEDLGF